MLAISTAGEAIVAKQMGMAARVICYILNMASECTTNVILISL